MSLPDDPLATRQATVADPPASDDDLVRSFCSLVGTPDVATYLGLDAHTTRHEALILLERRRRMLEAALDRPGVEREAELLLDHFDVLRRTIDRHIPTEPVRVNDGPDLYDVLGADPTASFAELEFAYRRSVQRGGASEQLAQAWRVLGHPLHRAHYDRGRRAGAAPDLHAPFDLPTGAEPFDWGLDEQVGACRAELPGDSTRDLVLEGDEPTLCSLPLIVRGSGRWRARVQCDHPCMQVRPADNVDLAPGRHALALRFDPRQVDAPLTTCTLTLANADEQHVLVFRLRRLRTTGFERFEPTAIALLAFALIALGWALGTRYAVVSSDEQPDSEGAIEQIPTAASCFIDARTTLPTWLDVHTDGLGRPTGFAFGGPVAAPVEDCIKQALLGLDFPPTPDGRPAFHRYHTSPTASPR